MAACAIFLIRRAWIRRRPKGPGKGAPASGGRYRLLPRRSARKQPVTQLVKLADRTRCGLDTTAQPGLKDAERTQHADPGQRPRCAMRWTWWVLRSCTWTLHPTSSTWICPSRLYEQLANGDYVQLYDPPFEFRASYARDLAHRHLLRAGVRTATGCHRAARARPTHPGRQPAGDRHRGHTSDPTGRSTTAPAGTSAPNRSRTAGYRCGSAGAAGHISTCRYITNATFMPDRPHRRTIPPPFAPSTLRTVTDDPKTTSFRELGLPDFLLEALAAVGYESPSPIQSETIPRMLKGEDVLGQAQTGTGKTAAFALPILARIDVSQNAPQALVMVPTRELAIQVAEAFQKYAVQDAGLSRAADLRRPELHAAAEGPEARRAGHRRDPGSRHGSHEARHAGPVLAALRGAGRRR